MPLLRILFFFIVLIAFGGFYLTQKSSASTKGTIQVIQPTALEYDTEKSRAFSYLNDMREASGLIRLSHDTILARSAQNHAKYLIANDALAHEEIGTMKEFTGMTPADRAIYAGYKTSFVVENISSGNQSYKDSVDNLFSAIYHRFAFLDFKVDEIGIGILQNTVSRSKTAFVYNMGQSQINSLCEGKSYSGYGRYIYGICADQNLKIKENDYEDAIKYVGMGNKTTVIYPYDGQEDVPPAFFDEVPDPLPEYKVSGFPISISFNEAYFKHIEIESFELFEMQNEKILNVRMYDTNSDPNKKFKKFEYALFPLERLKWNTTYQVRVVYLADGKKEEINWHFHTMAFSEILHEVTPRQSHFTIQKNISSIFYFKPVSPTDILQNIEFPHSLHIWFIDQNTLRITAAADAPDTVELTFGAHKLSLSIR